MKLKIKKNKIIGVNMIKLLTILTIKVLIISFMFTPTNGNLYLNVEVYIIALSSLIIVINCVLMIASNDINSNSNYRYNIYHVRKFKSKKGTMKYILHGQRIFLVKEIIPNLLFKVVIKKEFKVNNTDILIIKKLNSILNKYNDDYWEYCNDKANKVTEIDLTEESMYFKDDMVELKRVEKLKKISK